MSKGNRTWLITGCDKGMGERIAEAALRQGDNVAATLLSQTETGPLSTAFDGRCRYYHLDMRDLDSIAPTVSRIEADFGKIDVLVNNAGYGLVGAAEETTESEYRPLFDVNFFGMTEITKAVLPGMRSRRHGHIISTASQVGFVAMVGYAYYSASKFAMEGFCEALAVETAPLGIKVTILEPGAVRTDFAGGSMKSAKRSIEDYASTAGRVRQLVKDNNGLQPNDPQKIAEAICTIANDEAPPLRLVLGLDALAAIEKKLDRTRKTIDQWRDLASSVGFDA